MSLLAKLLGVISGNSGLVLSDQLLFDKVIGFRGVVSGVGTSTIVQNVAIALAEETDYSICVLDTNFITPTIYPMLVSGTDNTRKDYLDFSDNLADVMTGTNYRNLSVATLYNRTFIDLLSSKDNKLVVEKLMETLKTYFDIILIDLSQELTNISTYTAIKCNRIINVADQSLKCIYHIRKSLNTMVSLGVPIAKADKIIVNKTLPDVITNTNKVISEAGLELIGEIPLSVQVAINGVSGKRIYNRSNTEQELHKFSLVISDVLDLIAMQSDGIAHLTKTSDGDSNSESKTKKKKGLFGGFLGGKKKDNVKPINKETQESKTDNTTEDDEQFGNIIEINDED